MENIPNPLLKAEYDNKRFPKKWQAMLGCALMFFFTYGAVIGVIKLLGANYTEKFSTTFGSEMFFATLSQFFSILIVPLVILFFTKKDFFATVRMKKCINPLQILLLVITSAGIFFMAQGANSLFVSYLESFFGPHSPSADMTKASNIPQLIFELIVAGILPAFCEEIFYRGFVLRSFERSSYVVAVIVSSITFSLMHGNATQFAYALLVGIILGTVTYTSDSLFAGATIHFTLNALSVIVSYPPVWDFVDGFVNANPFIYTVIAYAVLPIIGVVALNVFLVYTATRNNKLYGDYLVSDMDNIDLMPKESPKEIFIQVICWVFFVIINLSSAVISWVGSL